MKTFYIKRTVQYLTYGGFTKYFKKGTEFTYNENSDYYIDPNGFRWEKEYVENFLQLTKPFDLFDWLFKKIWRK